VVSCAAWAPAVTCGMQEVTRRCGGPRTSGGALVSVAEVCEEREESRVGLSDSTPPPQAGLLDEAYESRGVRACGRTEANGADAEARAWHSRGSGPRQAEPALANGHPPSRSVMLHSSHAAAPLAGWRCLGRRRSITSCQNNVAGPRQLHPAHTHRTLSKA
jgi:hypothetical protein